MIESTDIDITEDFFKECSSINPGELCHVRNFDLQDVMTAIELMDPKMDARMQIQRKIMYLKESLGKNLLPLDENMAPKLLLGIIDETLACFVNWLKGDTLGQTVFINMYMHCTDQIQNKTLRGFCEGMKNIILFVKDIICKGSVAEEEDFYMSTSRMPLDDPVADNKVTGMLKDADDEYTRTLKTLACEEDDDVIRSLQDRVRFIRNLLLWTVVVKKYLQNPTSKPLKETTLTESTKYLSLLKGLIERMKDTISLGDQAGPGKHNPSQQCYGLVGFEPYLNQPLLPPAIPRCANIEERSTAIDFIQQTIIRLTHVMGILAADVSQNVIVDWDFLQLFGRFGCDGASQSCVLSRSLLLIFYMSSFSSPQLDSGVPSGATVSGTYLSNTAKIDTIKATLRHFIRLASWADLEATLKLDDKLTLFVGACAENLFQIPITHCLNRSRQRNRLELVIDAHWDLYDECVKVDHVLRTYLANNSLCSVAGSGGGGAKRTRDIPPMFSSFVALCQFRTMVDYLLSGFELALYGPEELPAVYFLLGDNVLRYYVSHWREVDLHQQREQAKLPRVANKKYRKQADREMAAAGARTREALQTVSVYQELTMGFFHLVCAMARDDRSASASGAVASSRYTNTELCYERRFGPVVGRGWFHETGSYRRFLGQMEAMATKSMSETYEMAALYFDSSRRLMDACQPHQFRDSTITELKTIAKNNMIVCRLLGSAGSAATKKVVLNFDQAKERAFPLIKIIK